MVKNLTPFEKSFDDLTDDEKLIWEAAAEVLNRGDRLYGQSPDDASHLWWALGLAIASLRGERNQLPEDKKAAAVYLELGVDESGFWISPIKMDDQDSSSKQPQEIN